MGNAPINDSQCNGFIVVVIGVGRGGKSSNIKERTLADWEYDEYRRELKNKKIRNREDEENEKFVA